MRNAVFFLVFAGIISFGLSAQGNLQFNQVLVINAQSGTQTVPAGKVWKITSQNLSGGVYYSNWSSTTNSTWSITNPNPCNGATSGTTSIRQVRKYKCPDANNNLVLNGVKTKLGESGPLWLPAGATLGIVETPCVSSLSPNIPSATPYYLEDRTDPNNFQYYNECDGPINAGAVPNSILVSVIEFNIVP